MHIYHTHYDTSLSAEITLETLAKSITDMQTMMTGFKAMDENHKDKEKEAAAKKAMDEKKMDDDKKEAKKAALQAAINKAMDEKDEVKKEAAIKKAMDDYDEKHKAMMDKEEHDKPKSHDASYIASLITKDKKILITKILTANKMLSPQNLPDVEARIKTASIEDLQKEWDVMQPFAAAVMPELAEGGNGIQLQQIPTRQGTPPTPYFANIHEMNPGTVDSSMLTANSPPSDFNKISTKELTSGMYQ